MMMISAAHRRRLLCTKVPIQFDHFSLHEKQNIKSKKKKENHQFAIRLERKHEALPRRQLLKIRNLSFDFFESELLGITKTEKGSRLSLLCSAK